MKNVMQYKEDYLQILKGMIIVEKILSVLDGKRIEINLSLRTLTECRGKKEFEDLF